MTSATLSEFERRYGIRVFISPARVDPAGERIIMLAAKTATSALAIVYDLSDSADATSRTAARLPGLLRGWERSTLVWIYALGDVMPLPGVAAATVGELVDGSTDLQGSFTDIPLLNKFRRRGSFIAPTLAALDDRTSAETVSELRVVVLSDGRLTDFDPVPPPYAEVLCLLEPDGDKPTARTCWQRVMGNAPIHSVGEPASQHWFLSRQQSPPQLYQLRFSGDGVRHSAMIPGQTSDTKLVDWLPSRGAMFVRVPQRTWHTLAVECRLDNGVVRIDVESLATALPIAETDLTRAQTALYGNISEPIDVLFDSLSAPAELDAAWQRAAEFFEAAKSRRPWPATGLPRSANADGQAVALICLCTRVPTGPAAGGDRLVIIGLRSKSRGVEFRAGDQSPMGALEDSYAIQYDCYEDRWQVVVSTSTQNVHRRLELHPTATNILPPLQTTDGTSWTAIFSGSLSH